MSFALIEFFDIRINVFGPVGQTREFALLTYSSRVAGGLIDKRSALTANVYSRTSFDARS
jgi:hypothetical protein